MRQAASLSSDLSRTSSLRIAVNLRFEVEHGHVAVVVGEFERVLAAVSVELDGDAVSVMKGDGHFPRFAAAAVGPLDGNHSAIDRGAFEMGLLLLFFYIA